MSTARQRRSSDGVASGEKSKGERALIGGESQKGRGGEGRQSAPRTGEAVPHRWQPGGRLDQNNQGSDREHFAGWDFLAGGGGVWAGADLKTHEAAVGKVSGGGAQARGRARAWG